MPSEQFGPFARSERLCAEIKISINSIDVETGKALFSMTVETLADKIARLARKCAVCGWEWLKKEQLADPKRCPNHECRSKDWRGKSTAVETEEA